MRIKLTTVVMAHEIAYLSLLHGEINIFAKFSSGCHKVTNVEQQNSTNILLNNLLTIAPRRGEDIYSSQV